MHRVICLLALSGVLIAGRIPDRRPVEGNQDPDTNVNSRYTVESVDVKGSRLRNLSDNLRSNLNTLIGEKLDPSVLGRYAAMIQKELREKVTVKVQKGSTQGNVVVAFEIEKTKPVTFDLSAPKFIYHSREGWSGIGEATLRVKDNVFRFGIVDDGDELTERLAGIRAGYERKNLFLDRVGVRFNYSNYHTQWNPSTLTAITSASPNGLNETGTGIPGIYRSRESFSPVLTIALAKPVTLSAGVDFVRLQPQYPIARLESANAMVATLRYTQRFGESGHVKKDEDDQFFTEVKAGYGLRTATRALDTDYVYVRHAFDSRLTWAHGANKVVASFTGGIENGRAPYFERFSAGNSQTLRGWNKYDLAPRGGDRIATGTIEYRYDFFMVFWDTGAVWDRGTSPSQKHGVGVGVHFDGFQVAVAFPVRDGRMTPVFLVGTSF